MRAGCTETILFGIQVQCFVQQFISFTEPDLCFFDFVGDRVFSGFAECFYKIIKLSGVMVVVIIGVGEKRVRLIFGSKLFMMVVMMSVAAGFVGVSFVKQFQHIKPLFCCRVVQRGSLLLFLFLPHMQFPHAFDLVADGL